MTTLTAHRPTPTVRPALPTVRPVARPSAAPDYRLTRRGRLVLVVLALLALAVVGLVFAGGSAATSEKEVTEVVVVAPGQTLWSIAADLADDVADGDVRATMRHLVDLNDLDSVELAAGQRLVVPAD